VVDIVIESWISGNGIEFSSTIPPFHPGYAGISPRQIRRFSALPFSAPSGRGIKNDQPGEASIVGVKIHAP